MPGRAATADRPGVLSTVLRPIPLQEGMKGARTVNPTAAAKRFQLRRKVVVEGKIVFETAWRIGTGKEGETMSDLGVMRAPDGSPLLPGSSVKGKLRHTC